MLRRYVPMKAGHVVLQQSMQRELGFLVHANLVGVGHKPWDTTRCRIGQGILTHQAFDFKTIQLQRRHLPLEFSEPSHFLQSARVSALIVALNIMT